MISISLYSKMTTTIRLFNTSITSLFFVDRIFGIYSLSNFQVCSTVLFTIITVLHIRPPNVFIL